MWDVTNIQNTMWSSAIVCHLSLQENPTGKKKNKQAKGPKGK